MSENSQRKMSSSKKLSEVAESDEYSSEDEQETPKKRSRTSDSESESEESSSSEEESEETTDADEKPKDELKPDEFVDVDIAELESMPSSAMLDEDETELWLVRVPRHKTLTKKLHRSVIKLPEQESEENKSVDRLLCTFRGSYAFREHSLETIQNLRAAFLKKSGSKSHFKIGML